MPRESRKSVPVQEFISLQVIDTKGSLVGTVKDISIDFANKGISVRVTTKNGREMDFGWDEVQSVEDVVLLKKEVELSPSSEETESRSSNPRSVQAHIICPNCGTSAVARAKFCSKCGSDLKS